MAYLAPTTLDAALQALGEDSWLVVAGGTDVLPAHVGRSLPERVLDISGIDELRGVEVGSDIVRIGALTTWSEIRSHPGLPEALRGLQVAAGTIGARQVQNAGTVGGNLCNASPAADGVPPLLTLDASVKLASVQGKRRLSLSDFLLGPRQTALQPGELLTAVEIPVPPADGVAGFSKLGSRAHLVISIVSVASLVRLSPAGTVEDIRLAVASCAPTGKRLSKLERDLRGEELSESLVDQIGPQDLVELSPIDDIRGSAEYRREACVVMVRRLLMKACRR